MKTLERTQNLQGEGGGRSATYVRTLLLDPQPIQLPADGGTITREEWHRQMAAYRAVHPWPESSS